MEFKVFFRKFQRQRFVWQMALVTISIFVMGRLGLMMPYFNSSISLFWLPTGIGLAALVRFDSRLWMAMLMGSFFTNLTAGTSAIISIGIAIGSSLSIYVSYLILRQFKFRKNLSRRKDLVLLVFAAAMGMQLSALIGVFNLYMGNALAKSELLDAWRNWWLGDTAGILLATPFLLTISRESIFDFLKYWREIIPLVIVSIAITMRYFFFLDDISYALFSFFIIVWSALRFGQNGASIFVLMLSGLAALSTSIGRSPFATAENGLFVLWTYMISLAILSLIITALQAANVEMIKNLRVSNEKLKEAQELSKVGSWEFNYITHELVWSSELYNIFEIQEPQPLDKLYALYLSKIHPDEIQIFDQVIKKAIQIRESFHHEHRIIMGDGCIKNIVVIGKFSCEKCADLNLMCGTIQDITETKRLNAKIAENEQKLIRTSKLASLGELSAGIAHEINNPLAIILGTVNQISRNGENYEKMSHKIEAIRKASERISKIVGGLKKFSRSSVGNDYSICFLSEIIKETLIMTEAKSKKFNTPVNCEIQSEGRIYCDQVEIEQVLINLINNAIDAVRDKNERWVKIELFDDAQVVVLRVVDSGSGVPKNVQDKIFEPFFTTKPIGEGTGLGLSIAKGIIDEHKATIQIIGEMKNTCFEIRFQKALEKNLAG